MTLRRIKKSIEYSCIHKYSNQYYIKQLGDSSGWVFASDPDFPICFSVAAPGVHLAKAYELVNTCN